DYSSHPSKAVQEAEILVAARLRKSELIHEPCVVENPSVTVRVIGRTKLSIGGGARGAAGDAVKIALPGPANSVAHADVDCIWQKREFVFRRSYYHRKNPCPTVWLSIGNLPSILIEYADGLAPRCRDARLVVSRVGGPCECNQKQHCQTPRLLRHCL